jgi:hypothetical protein
MKRAPNRTEHFGICLNNQGYPAALEVGKLYRVIPDEEASAHGYVRVVDESGEDYAFEAKRFHIIQLPNQVSRKLMTASQK